MTIKIAKVEKLYKSPGPQPNGLQAAEDGLWCIDQVDLKLYRTDYESGEVVFEADTDTEHSSGVTLGAGSVWVASTFELKIARLDPETGKTQEKYESPGSGVVAWVEDNDSARKTGAHGLEWALRDNDAVEMLRVWIAEGRLHCSIKVGMYHEEMSVLRKR